MYWRKDVVEVRVLLSYNNSAKKKNKNEYIFNKVDLAPWQYREINQEGFHCSDPLEPNHHHFASQQF